MRWSAAALRAVRPDNRPARPDGDRRHDRRSRDGRPDGGRPDGGRPDGGLPDGSKSARFDFDGDGRDEIVSGAFTTTTNPQIPGGDTVVVEYSSLSRRDYLTAPVPAPSSPGFGEPLAAGDFNADGYADLAITNPGESVPGGNPADGAFAGAVWVFYGSPTGLNSTNPQHLSQNTAGIPGDMEYDDFFGADLATGDLNGDGYDDLAVGVPGEDPGGVADGGMVTVLFGSAIGITTTGVQTLTQNSPGVPDATETYDRFGTSLTIGDVTGDGHPDLAVGAPGESDATHGGSGIVTLIPGTGTGLATTGATTLMGLKDLLSLIQGFGYRMRIADFDGDGRGELVVSAGNLNPGGYIVYVPGSANGLTMTGVRVIGQETPGVPGTEGDSDSFGYSIATGDVTGDGRADLLIGAMTKDIGSVKDAGAVYLMPGTPAGLTGAGTQMLTQDALSIRNGRRVSGEKPEPHDFFGESVSILDLDGVGGLEMVVGGRNEYSPGSNGDVRTGILVTLRLRSIPTLRGPAIARVLTASTWRLGTALSTPVIRVVSVGRTLLNA